MRDYNNTRKTSPKRSNRKQRENHCSLPPSLWLHCERGFSWSCYVPGIHVMALDAFVQRCRIKFSLWQSQHYANGCYMNICILQQNQCFSLAISLSWETDTEKHFSTQIRTGKGFYSESLINIFDVSITLTSFHVLFPKCVTCAR